MDIWPGAQARRGVLEIGQEISEPTRTEHHAVRWRLRRRLLALSGHGETAVKSALLRQGGHWPTAASRLDLAPVTLDQADLPEYALPTTLHIFAANLSSLVVTLLVATLAANSRKAGSRSCRRRRRPNETRGSLASPRKPPPGPP